MQKAKTWEAETGGKLDLPAEVRRGLRLKVIYGAAAALSVCWCHKATVGTCDVELTGVLVDTSQRHGGITLRRSLTWWPKLVLVNTPATVLVIGEEEAFDV